MSLHASELNLVIEAPSLSSYIRKLSLTRTTVPLIIPYKHLYVQKYSNDVRLRCDRNLSLHETKNFIFAELTLQLRYH